jgi:hypothetical protein
MAHPLQIHLLQEPQNGIEVASAPCLSQNGIEVASALCLSPDGFLVVNGGWIWLTGEAPARSRHTLQWHLGKSLAVFRILYVRQTIIQILDLCAHNFLGIDIPMKIIFLNYQACPYKDDSCTQLRCRWRGSAIYRAVM